jgi:hypothetical protein
MRRACFESLESRHACVGDLPYATGITFLDVNEDAQVSPIDALLVINDLNRNGARVFDPYATPVSGWIDVNGNGWVTPLDALLIINHINQYGTGPYAPAPVRTFQPFSVPMDLSIPDGVGAFVFRPPVFDLGGEPLVFSIEDAPDHGRLTPVGEEFFLYEPSNDGFVGEDLITLLATSQHGLRRSITLRFALRGGGGSSGGPVATDDEVEVERNVQLTFNAVYNDRTDDGPLVITGFTQPQHGVLEQDPSGSLIYTPNSGYVGTDRCTYTVQDALGRTATGTITIRVL